MQLVFLVLLLFIDEKMKTIIDFESSNKIENFIIKNHH